QEVDSVAVDPLDPNTVYAAVDDAFSAALYKSTDGGLTWSPTGFADSGHVVVDPVDPSVLYIAGAHSAVYKSTDAGVTWRLANNGLTGGAATWSPASTGLLDRSLASMAVSSSGVLAGAEYGGLYRSTDGGATWTFSSSGIVNTDVLSVAVDPSDPSTVYAGTVFSGIS